MDATKAQVAASVRRGVFNHKGELQAVLERDVEVHVVDDLNTHIRVSTDHGPRYFLVKVSEQL